MRADCARIDGAVVNLALLPTTALNIRADTTGSTGAISFVLNGRLHRVELVPPYALAGDRNGDYKPWTPTPGAHTLTATPQNGQYKFFVVSSKWIVTF